MFKINDQSKHMISEKYRNMILDLYSHVKSQLNFDKDISELQFVEDESNGANPLGNTAFYEPNNQIICIYCSGRHIKDILRSFSHELIHHNQNCSGKLGGDLSLEDGYAQTNKDMRDLEKDAYLNGNLLFRDWEDSKKRKSKKMKKNNLTNAPELQESQLDKRKNREKLANILLAALMGASTVTIGAATAIHRQNHGDELQRIKDKEANKKNAQAIEAARDEISHANRLGKIRSKWASFDPTKLKEGECNEECNDELHESSLRDNLKKALIGGLIGASAVGAYKGAKVANSALDSVMQSTQKKMDPSDMIKKAKGETTEELKEGDSIMNNKPVWTSKVKFDKEWNEYVVRFFKDGVHYEPADYFTDDKEDAMSTAKHGTEKMNKQDLQENDMAKPVWTSKVKFDKEWNEYVVRFYKNGVHYEPADYFTDDKEDAMSTAKHGPEKMNKQGLQENDMVYNKTTEKIDHALFDVWEATKDKDIKALCSLVRQMNKKGQFDAELFEEALGALIEYRDSIKHGDVHYHRNLIEPAIAALRTQIDKNKGLQENVRTGVDPYKELTLLESRRKIVTEETTKALGVKFDFNALLNYKKD